MNDVAEGLRGRGPLPHIPPDVVALADYERLARRQLDPRVAAWLFGGAADEHTLEENCAAFRRLRLKPRVLCGLEGGDTRLTLLGQQLDYPVLLAPIAHQRLVHPQGELAMALGAAAVGATMVVSTQASISLEDIAKRAVAPLWFQLYVHPDRGITRDLVARAENAGYRALVLTVDAPVAGMRNREQRLGFAMPEWEVAANLKDAPPEPAVISRAGESPIFAGPLPAAAPRWADVESLLASTRLPVILKGVLAPEDAEHAIAAGVAGIAVSNHGGRTLDTLPATIDALPAIAEAVAGRVPVLLDGGVRRGTDVFKALALGATAVMVGRPCVAALAVAGAAGVAHALHILRAELEVAMVLAGCRRLSDIDRSRIW
ncbi:MAG: alpha-hydroxy acid oxidase [Gammaproteobacteria bacterium]|jgi:4-hydroxymandelate oxidase|nr:alpha-hydroxy acid oxidase [Gammaproteobacteria bacterium]